MGMREALTQTGSGGREMVSETCSPHVQRVIKNMLLHMQTVTAAKQRHQSDLSTGGGGRWGEKGGTWWGLGG